MDALVDASFTPMSVVFVVLGGREKAKGAIGCSRKLLFFDFVEKESLRAVEAHPLKHSSDGRVAQRQVRIR